MGRPRFAGGFFRNGSTAATNNGAGGDYQSEFRVSGQNNQIRWLEARGRFERDNEGRPLRSYGVMMDITGRKQAEEALRESEGRERKQRQELETALAVIPVGVFIAEDKACARITANPNGSELLRILEGRNASKSAPEDERPSNFEAYSSTGGLLAADQLPMQRAAATGKSIHGFEHELRFADGGHRHLLGNALPLFDAAGEVRGAVGAFLDITERRHQEERIGLLLREVNHRAKNMLGVVQAIASQTAALGREDFVARFSERILALAANQDLLVKSEWQGVDLADLVRAQLLHFEDPIGSRIEIAGPPLWIAAEAAQPIAMALHELATNAGKYGALSVGMGKVSIEWHIERERTFHLSWTERAGPVVTSPTRLGFGTTVITYVPEVQLGAEVTLDYPPEGVTWRLACPAENVLEPGRGGANGG